jgi:hypothetical protein
LEAIIRKNPDPQCAARFPRAPGFRLIISLGTGLSRIDCRVRDLSSPTLEINGTIRRESGFGLENRALLMQDDQARNRRKLATECLIAARQSTDPDLCAVFLGMAQKWLDPANGDFDPSHPDDLDRAIYRQIIRANLGRELQSRFGISRDLPQQMMTLLIRLDAD